MVGQGNVAPLEHAVATQLCGEWRCVVPGLGVCLLGVSRGHLDEEAGVLPNAQCLPLTGRQLCGSRGKGRAGAPPCAERGIRGAVARGSWLDGRADCLWRGRQNADALHHATEVLTLSSWLCA